jgi:RHS repeat-associated protein
MIIRQRLWKKLWRTSLCLLLAVSLVLTGFPFFPGAGIKTVMAATTVSVGPSPMVTVYGGLSDISWNYGDKTHSSTLERCEVEPIPPAFEPYEGADGRTIYPPTHSKDSLGFIGSKSPGSLGETEKYEWDGKVDGQLLMDGSYIVCVEPSGAPEYFGFGYMSVFNPTPPAPIYMEIVPNPSSDSHIIRGVAERGTEVSLEMWVTKRIGEEQIEDRQMRALVDANKVEIDSIEVEDTRSWSAGKPIEASYFTNFPLRADNQPEDYVGEWEVEVTLPSYEIAHITAKTKRIIDQKESGPSEMLQVLRYKAPGWGVKWAVLTGYYYDEILKEEIESRIHNIVSFNGLPIESCEGQTCYGGIKDGMNVLLMLPQKAGVITETITDEIEQEFIYKNGFPISTYFDPIHLPTGNFGFHHTNMTLQALMPLNFTVSYQSRDKFNGDIGVGWHHSYEMRLEEREAGVIYVATPEGASFKYMPLGNGRYETPPGSYDQLTQNSDGSYTLITPQKWTYVFRKDGLLYEIIDPNANVTQLKYYGAVLEEVSTVGAKMSFTYGAAGKIAKVTDHTGREVKYGYDAINHNLKSITLSDGAVIAFDYDEDYQMTAIHNPNETSSLINIYDDQGRVIRQRDFSGAWGDLAYFPEQQKTTITDQLGRVRTFEYDQRYRQTAVHYPDDSVERFAYDANDNMTQITDRNGNDTRYVYDETGNLLQSIDPLGKITDIQYNEFNKPSVITDALGQQTVIDYDHKGNMSSVVDAKNHSLTIERDAKGVPTMIRNPEGEKTTVTSDQYGFAKFTTDPEGNRQELVRDPLHRVTQMIDALGHKTTMEYDARDRIKSTVDALSQSDSYVYDKNSNLIQYTDVSGASTTYQYDTFDRLASVTDALGQTIHMTYDAVGNVIKRKDPNGAVTQYKYDAVDRLIEMIDPEGGVSRFTYDANGNLLTSTDPEGGTIEIAYDARNLPITVKDAEGAVTTHSYDALGRLIRETNDLGHAAHYEYDELGQVVKITNALNHTSSFEYDKAGRLVKTTNPNGAVWQMNYDARGLMTSVTDPLGNLTMTVHDALGQAIQSIDEEGNATHYTYDPLGRVISILDSLGQHTAFNYDQRGLIQEVRDAKQQTTLYDYDAIGRLVAVTNALNQSTSYNYDAAGNILSKTDANQNITTYQYDKNNQLTRQINPLGELTELAYDHNGNVTDILYPDGKTTSYDYDHMNRLASILYPDHKQVGYSYDSLGRRTSMTDEHGTTSYGYDALNRLTEVTNAANQTIQYEWTPTGQRSRVIYPDQSAVAYDYDLMDQMIRVTDGSGGIASYTYDKRGLLQTKTLPTQATSTYEYDRLGQLQELKHTNQRGKVMEHLLYEYDPVGNRIRYERIEEGNDEDDGDASESRDSVINEYAYDALNQLIEVSTQNKNNPESLVATSYSYDSVGNRLSKESVWGQLTDTEIYTYDGADKLLHWNNGANYKDFTYDKRGNLLKIFGVVGADDFNPLNSLTEDGEITVTNQVYDPTVTEDVYDLFAASSAPPEPKVLEQYAWNSANRLNQHTNPWGDVTQYFYDGDNNRIKMTVDVKHGPNERGNGNGNNGNDNGNGNGNPNSNPNCHIVPPGFIPPGLAKKCGQLEEPYPDEHPGGPRDGWERQHKKKHWEFHYTNDVSLALPEPIQATDKSQLTSEEPYYKWKETYAYGAGQERISMTYLPAYDHDNGWEPTPGDGGAGPDATPKTLYYLNDALGSVLGLIEQDGRVSSRYHYDEFGIVSDQKKFDVNWPGPDNLFGYTGLGYDYYSDLSYARARYYKPELGRFISEDTYEGVITNPLTLNLYTYVGNNPLTRIDPSGNDWLDSVSGFLDSLADELTVGGYGYAIGLIEDATGTGPNSNPDYFDGKAFYGEYMTPQSEYEQLALILLPGFKGKVVSNKNSILMPKGMNLSSLNSKLKEPTFAKGQLLNRHFKNHGLDFGPITKEEYLRKAQSFFQLTPEGLDVFVNTRKSDGALVFYRQSTNEFGVVTTDGVIKTYYKPSTSVHSYSTNFNYYLAEINK